MMIREKRSENENKLPSIVTMGKGRRMSIICENEGDICAIFGDI
jgi:hypothetical protein